MEKRFELIKDDFPKLLADAVAILHQLPIPFSTIENVIAEAMEEEVMYRFADVHATEKTDKLLVDLIYKWSEELSQLTGKPWNIKKIENNKI